MNKLSKVIIVTVGGVAVVALALYLFVYVSVDGLQDSTQKASKIVFSDLKDTVHAIASAWGLTGDHIEIVISNSSIVVELQIAVLIIFITSLQFITSRKMTLWLYILYHLLMRLIILMQELK